MKYIYNGKNDCCKFQISKIIPWSMRSHQIGSSLPGTFLHQNQYKKNQKFILNIPQNDIIFNKFL